MTAVTCSSSASSSSSSTSSTSSTSSSSPHLHSRSPSLPPLNLSSLSLSSSSSQRKRARQDRSPTHPHPLSSLATLAMVAAAVEMEEEDTLKRRRTRMEVNELDEVDSQNGKDLEEEGQSGWAHLFPTDVLLCILETLDAPSLCTCMLLCKSWHALITRYERRLWSNLCYLVYNIPYTNSLVSVHPNDRPLVAPRLPPDDEHNEPSYHPQQKRYVDWDVFHVVRPGGENVQKETWLGAWKDVFAARLNLEKGRSVFVTVGEGSVAKGAQHDRRGQHEQQDNLDIESEIPIPQPLQPLDVVTETASIQPMEELDLHAETNVIQPLGQRDLETEKHTIQLENLDTQHSDNTSPTLLESGTSTTPKPRRHIFAWPEDPNDAYLVCLDGRTLCWVDADDRTIINLAIVPGDSQHPSHTTTPVQPAATLRGHVRSIGLVLSNARGLLASFDESSAIFIWELGYSISSHTPTGRLIRRINADGELGFVYSMNLHGTRVITGSRTGRVVIFDAITGDRLVDLGVPKPYVRVLNERTLVNVAVWGRWAAYGLFDGRFFVYDCVEKKYVWRFEGGSERGVRVLEDFWGEEELEDGLEEQSEAGESEAGDGDVEMGDEAPEMLQEGYPPSPPPPMDSVTTTTMNVLEAMEPNPDMTAPWELSDSSVPSHPYWGVPPPPPTEWRASTNWGEVESDLESRNSTEEMGEAAAALTLVQVKGEMGGTDEVTSDFTEPRVWDLGGTGSLSCSSSSTQTVAWDMCETGSSSSSSVTQTVPWDLNGTGASSASVSLSSMQTVAGDPWDDGEMEDVQEERSASPIGRVDRAMAVFGTAGVNVMEMSETLASVMTETLPTPISPLSLMPPSPLPAVDPEMEQPDHEGEEEVVEPLTPHVEPSAALAPMTLALNGDMLLTNGVESHSLAVWDLRSGRCLHTLSCRGVAGASLTEAGSEWEIPFAEVSQDGTMVFGGVGGEMGPPPPPPPPHGAVPLPLPAAAAADVNADVDVVMGDGEGLATATEIEGGGGERGHDGRLVVWDFRRRGGGTGERRFERVLLDGEIVVWVCYEEEG